MKLVREKGKKSKFQEDGGRFREKGGSNKRKRVWRSRSKLKGRWD